MNWSNCLSALSISPGPSVSRVLPSSSGSGLQQIPNSTVCLSVPREWWYKWTSGRKLCSQFQAPQVLHCVLELNFTSIEQDLGCRFTEGKVWSLLCRRINYFQWIISKQTLCSVNVWRRTRGRKTWQRRALSRNVISENYPAEVFFSVDE